jgi:hypothetical protein
MNMASPNRTTPSAISTHTHHGGALLPDACALGAALAVVVWVTVVVFGGAVTVAVAVVVVVVVDVEVEVEVEVTVEFVGELWVVVVVVWVVATGSAVAEAPDAADAVVRPLLACEATLDAADLAW